MAEPRRSITEVRVNLEREYRRKVLDLTTLHEITHHLNAVLKPRALVDFFLTTLRGHFGLSLVVYLHKRGSLCEFFAAKGLGKRPHPEAVNVDEPLVRALVEDGARHACADLAAQAPFADALASLSATGAEHWMALVSQRELLGLIGLGPRLAGGGYSEDDDEYLAILARHFAVALVNAITVERIEEAERRTESAYEKLRALDLAKTKFVGLASHELNTPVAVIDLSLYSLRHHARRGDPKTMEDALSIADGAVARLREIIEDLVLLAKGDEQVALVKPRRGRFREVLDAVLPVLRLYRKDRPEIAFHAEIEEDLPELNFDARQIERVLLALFQNGIKYMPPDREGRLTLIVAREGAGLCCRVRDTGIGMDAATREHVFDRFFEGGELRHHSTSKTMFLGGGMGLGLTIAKLVIEAHGGRIDVESPGLGQGATVSFTLPGIEG